MNRLNGRTPKRVDEGVKLNGAGERHSVSGR